MIQTNMNVSSRHTAGENHPFRHYGTSTAIAGVNKGIRNFRQGSLARMGFFQNAIKPNIPMLRFIYRSYAARVVCSGYQPQHPRHHALLVADNRVAILEDLTHQVQALLYLRCGHRKTVYKEG